jgi:putative transposase
MINKHNVKIADHLKIHEIDELIKGYKVQMRFYQRLIFMRSIMTDSTIKEASESVGVTTKTGYNWLNSYNNKGLDGLIPNFGGGKPAYLTDEEFDELYNILKEDFSNYTIEEVRKLIIEKFGVEYTYKQAWVITRKKFKLNYGKPAPEAPDRPKDRKEILKKTKSRGLGK